MTEKNLNCILVIELAVLAFTFLGTNIVLYIHFDKKWNRHISFDDLPTERLLEAIRQDIKTYHTENSEMMRDFHGSLCAIEARRR